MRISGNLLAPVASFVGGVAAVGILYALALPGHWSFDDPANLSGLSQVQQLHSALGFMLAGEAGPLGRPVSLATFAAQAGAWDTRPAAMLVVNFGIHLLAMLAVFLLATGLARVRTHESTLRAYWIGALVAVLWGLSPFLATTHLMVIQRMTSLAGLFVFAGLALFVWAHLLQRPFRVRAALILGLGFGTALATLSKENGALLPLLAMVVLLFWIPREQWLTGNTERILIGMLVVLPSLALILYLGTELIETLQRGGYGARRDFTPVERLLSQPVILLDYLRQLLVPRTIAVTPFMDHIPASRGLLDPPITLIALLFWITAIVAGFTVRRAAPWFLFGVFFFLTGHLIESTYVGLELYFAHRNYVPAFGLFFGLVFFVTTVAPRRFTLALGFLFIYAVGSGLVLFQVTSHWNDKHANAVLWVDYNPHSVRAVQLLSHEQAAAGDLYAAWATLDRAATSHPSDTLLRIQHTGICPIEDRFPDTLSETIALLSTSKRYAAAASIELLRIAQRVDPSPLCPPRNHGAILRMADALLENPAYNRHQDSRVRLKLAKAFSHAEMEEYDAAIALFEQAFRIKPNLGVAFRTASLMANNGDYEAAYRFLDDVKDAAPTGPWVDPLWNERVGGFKEILQQSERM